MTYEEALRINPSTLEEALEKAFWKAAGRGCLGVGLPETWAAVAAAGREFLASQNADSDPDAVDPDRALPVDAIVQVVRQADAEGRPVITEGNREAMRDFVRRYNALTGEEARAIVQHQRMQKQVREFFEWEGK